ncbi:hypothetical protein [Brachyspira sp.]|uniref:hypothetical protein n=1 Tax=Brachyspira sp. TaxID=1977261 RepID=UPI0026399D7C|nr:hypothetical protein [Brachyspira sp.]
MYNLYNKIIILSLLLIITMSCQKKEIISIEKDVVDRRFVGSWELVNGNEKYTFFNNNKIEYISNNHENKVYTYEWKKEGSNYYYRLWDNELDSWSAFPIKYISTNMIKYTQVSLKNLTFNI